MHTASCGTLSSISVFVPGCYQERMELLLLLTMCLLSHSLLGLCDHSTAPVLLLASGACCTTHPRLKQQVRCTWGVDSNVYTVYILDCNAAKSICTHTVGSLQKKVTSSLRILCKQLQRACEPSQRAHGPSHEGLIHVNPGPFAT